MLRATLVRAAPAAIHHRVAAHFYEVCGRLPAADPIVVALPGGESMKRVLEAIAAKAGDHREIVERLQIFQVDEFRYSDARPETNFDVIQEHLIEHVDRRLLRRSQIHKFEFSDDRVRDLRRYGDLLKGFGGRFHVVFLGAGAGQFADGAHDLGHVGAIFGGMPHLWSVPGDFLAHDDSPKPPSHRVTATPALIARSEYGILLLLGENKRPALTAYLAPEVTEHDCPAKIIDRIPNGTVFTDLSA